MALLGVVAVCVLVATSGVPDTSVPVRRLFEQAGMQPTYMQAGAGTGAGTAAASPFTLWVNYITGVVQNNLPYAIAALIFSFFYKQKVVDKLPHLEGQKGSKPFSHGLCDCCGHCDVLLHHWCCLSSVAGKNLEVAGVMGFWPGCIMMYLSVTIGSAFCCVGPIVRTIFFSKIKKNIGIEDNFAKDCCLQLFCFPCSVAQESMEIDSMLDVEIGFLSVSGPGLQSGSESGSES